MLYQKTTVLIKAIKMLSATNIYCGSDTLYLNTCYIYMNIIFVILPNELRNTSRNTVVSTY